MNLRTARLSLEPFATAHAPELLALFRDPHVRRYLLDDELVDLAWVEEEVRASEARSSAGSVGLYLARDGAAVAGFCGFRPFFEPPVLELLYGLLPAYVGRGLATELATAMIEHAFGVLGWHEVRASTDAPNQASVRVLERLGMRLVGRDPGPRWEQLHFALSRSDWTGR